MNSRPLKIYAESLDRLIRKNNPKTNRLAESATVAEIVYKKTNPRLFSYLVKGGQSYSSKKGYIVNILFTDAKIRKNGQLLNKNILCSCTCPAFQYWGAAYNATQGRYKLGKAENNAPDIRDPNRKNKLCKHIVAVKENIKQAKIASASKVKWNRADIKEILLDITDKPIATDSDFQNLMEQLLGV